MLVTCDIVPGATSYNIQRSVDGVNFTTIQAPVVPLFLDYTVTQGVQYFYQMAATNGTGDSPFTSVLSAVPSTSGLLCLSQLRTMSRQRADRVNSPFITDSELNVYINQSYFELYDMLVTLYEDYYMAVPALLQTTGASVQQYPLPDGITPFVEYLTGNSFIPKPFYKLLGVDCGLANNTNAWVSLHKFDFISRNRYVFPNVTSTYLGVFNLRYRIVGNTIFFIPTPSAGQFMRLWYVPRLVQLLQDTDLCDGVSGWTEYIIIDAAIKILQKEEADVSVLAAQKMAMIDRIQSSAMNRDAGAPDTITDNRRMSSGWFGGGPNGDGSFGGF